MSLRTWLRWLRARPDCRQVAAVMQSYLDGEIGPDQAELVAAHLEHCERCGIEAEVYRDVKASLEQLRPPVDDAALNRLRTFATGLAGRDPR